MQEIESGLKIGYGVVIADVNGDGKPDIVVADANRVVWYENPTWKRRTMIEGKVPPDIVCIAPCDIDGDGKIDFFIGADWRPFDTKSGGTIHWMRRGKTLDDLWEVFKIGEEPTVHRMKVAQMAAKDKRPWLIVAPLMGRDSTKEKNWTDGRPVRLFAYGIPRDPVRGPWERVELDTVDDLHVVHGLWTGYFGDIEDEWLGILTASFEGVGLGASPFFHLSTGNQSNPKGNRGASEVHLGRMGRGDFFVAAIEPWHGHEAVVYRLSSSDRVGMISGKLPLPRRVIDDKLRWGHGLWCADLDGDGKDEIIVGVRDDLSKETGERRGVRIYKCLDGRGEKWQRQIVDNGGIACEDLTCADLNGDGKIDIIAVGRQTGNCRIYWNLGKP